MQGREISWAAKISDSLRGRHRGEISSGRTLTKEGYVMLTGSTHPLSRRGSVLEHRKVLYDAIGPGPHECHWNSLSGCGKTQLVWSMVDRVNGLHVDHLNNIQDDNRPENLVPSCLGCNWNRQNPVHSWGGESSV